MNKNLSHLRQLLIITFLLTAYIGYAQEATVTYPDSTKLDLTKPILIENELNSFDQINLKFPRLNPAINFNLNLVLSRNLLTPLIILEMAYYPIYIERCCI